MSSPPPYTQPGAPQTFAPPIIFQQTQINGYVLKADWNSAQAQVDRLLNAPSGGNLNFRAISSHVILYDAVFGKAYFKSTQSMGWSREREVGIWIPLLQMTPDSFSPIRLCCLSPYLFVDNPVALCTGREVYGFFKQWGSIASATFAGTGRSTFLEVLGVEQFSDQTQIGQVPLLSVTQKDAGPNPTVLTSIADLGKFLFTALEIGKTSGSPGPTITDAQWQALLAKGASLVFLKEFRDGSESETACYVAVTQVNPTIDSFVSASLGGAFDFLLCPLASHPLQQEYGLTTQPGLASFSLQVDMTFPGANILWKAPT